VRGRSHYTERLNDALKYAFHIRQYVIVPKSDDDVALGLQILRANLIVTQTKGVLTTIELDNESRFSAAKV
jgi:hypothetical protein